MIGFLLVGPLLMVACVGFPMFGSKAPEAQGGDRDRTADGGREVSTSALELQHVRYDGLRLSGRLLVGALVDGVRLDKRLLSNIHVNVNSVRDCAEKEVPYAIMDYFVPSPRDEDLLILNRGYWYGAPAYFPLFVEPGPDCVLIELSLLSWEGRRVGSVRVRAERAPPMAMDSGLPEDPQPTDAGVP